MENTINIKLQKKYNKMHPTDMDDHLSYPNGFKIRFTLNGEMVTGWYCPVKDTFQGVGESLTNPLISHPIDGCAWLFNGLHNLTDIDDHPLSYKARMLFYARSRSYKKEYRDRKNGYNWKYWGYVPNTKEGKAMAKRDIKKGGYKNIHFVKVGKKKGQFWHDGCSNHLLVVVN